VLVSVLIHTKLQMLLKLFSVFIALKYQKFSCDCTNKSLEFIKKTFVY